MVIKAADIELFEDLIQVEVNNKFYDLHNEYDCEAFLFKEGCLLLKFKKVQGAEIFRIEFKHVSIVYFDFNFEYPTGKLTIDQLYRGRFEDAGKVLEFSDKGSFFYLSFSEGGDVHFFTDEIILEVL